MVKTCSVCNHTGELTWRDGKYYCAMCGSEVSETAPTAQPQQNLTVSDVTCPICKNGENNIFDGKKYRCALCGTSFDRPREEYTPTSFTYTGNTQRVQELKKQRDKNLILGLVFVFLFWPVSIYFFYKFYKIGNELKALGH